MGSGIAIVQAGAPSADWQRHVLELAPRGTLAAHDAVVPDAIGVSHPRAPWPRLYWTSRGRPRERPRRTLDHVEHGADESRLQGGAM
jgi:hypothetical protein